MMVPERLVAVCLALICFASRITQGLSSRLPMVEELNSASRIDTEIDFDGIIKNLSATKMELTSFGGKNWQSALLSELEHSMPTLLWTDCIFTVGRDGEEEKIRAHSALLMVASPVFKVGLTNSSSLRLKEWQPTEFKTLLRMIYTGEMCFKNFEEACTLMKYASRLKIEDIHEAAFKYITTYMHPNRVWDALHCAREISDEKLLQKVTEVISSNTTKYLRGVEHSTYCKISDDDLVYIFERDDITIRSEDELFEFALTWAANKLLDAGKNYSDINLVVQEIRPKILKNIRLLADVTITDFVDDDHACLHVLGYDDCLALKNSVINPAEVVELPKHLSASRIKRKLLLNATEETFTSVVLDAKCESYSTDESIYDLLTTLELQRWEMPLIGIQIPKSLEARENCNFKERFDVLIIDSNNKTVYKHTYDQVPPCETTRLTFVKTNGKNNYDTVSDDKLIDVKFSKPVLIPNHHGLRRWRVKIVFHDVGKYPKNVESGTNDPTIWGTRIAGYLNDFAESPGFTHTLMSGKSFVYAVVVKGSHL